MCTRVVCTPAPMHVCAFVCVVCDARLPKCAWCVTHACVYVCDARLCVYMYVVCDARLHV